MKVWQSLQHENPTDCTLSTKHITQRKPIPRECLHLRCEIRRHSLGCVPYLLSGSKLSVVVAVLFVTTECPLHLVSSLNRFLRTDTSIKDIINEKRGRRGWDISKYRLNILKWRCKMCTNPNSQNMYWELYQISEYTFIYYVKLSGFVAQLVRVSLPGLCCAQRRSFEARPNPLLFINTI